MLSAESASGKYPIHAVRMMDGIIAEVERDPHYRTVVDAAHPPAGNTIADAISSALQHATDILPVVATIAYTSSGSSALRAARERPSAPILGLTPSIETARLLALVWGVHPVRVREVENVDEMVQCATETTMAQGFGRPGDIVAIATGMPFRIAGTTNLLRIARLEAAVPSEAEVQS